MVVNGIDSSGRNILLTIEAVQMKALRAVLSAAGNSAVAEATAAMNLDGHGLTASEVRAVVDQFILSLASISNAISHKEDVPDKPKKSTKVLVN